MNRKFFRRIDTVFQQSDALLLLLKLYEYDDYLFHALTDHLKIQFIPQHTAYESKPVLTCQQADRMYTISQESPGSYTINSCIVGENDKVDRGRDLSLRQMLQDALAIKKILERAGLKFDPT